MTVGPQGHTPQFLCCVLGTQGDSVSVLWSCEGEQGVCEPQKSREAGVGRGTPIHQIPHTRREQITAKSIAMQEYHGKCSFPEISRVNFLHPISVPICDSGSPCELAWSSQQLHMKSEEDFAM